MIEVMFGVHGGSRGLLLKFPTYLRHLFRFLVLRKYENPASRNERYSLGSWPVSHVKQVVLTLGSAPGDRH